MTAALGVRLNNPLNIERSKIQWAGLSAEQSHNRFCCFETPSAGIRAAAVNLRTYFRKYGLATVEAVVRRWAPPGENDTGAYVNRVASEMGVGPGERIDLSDPSVMCRLVTAMMRVEVGGVPYPPELIQGAVLAAYEDKDMKVNQPSKAPSAKVSVGATVSALAGFPVAWVVASLWNATFPENPMPTEVAMGVGSGIGTAFYFAAAYLTQDKVPVE